jgi:hypothetical protein
MTGKIFVKPAVEGALVRQVDRDMRPLPQEGAWVVDTMLWRRLILTGDVVEAEPVADPAADPRGLADEMNAYADGLKAAAESSMLAPQPPADEAAETTAVGQKESSPRSRRNAE